MNLSKSDKPTPSRNLQSSHCSETAIRQNNSFLEIDEVLHQLEPAVADAGVDVSGHRAHVPQRQSLNDVQYFRLMSSMDGPRHVSVQFVYQVGQFFNYISVLT